MAGGFITNSSPFVDSTFTWPVAGPGEGPGGLAPPLFLDKTDARRAEKNFLGDCSPPLSFFFVLSSTLGNERLLLL